MFPSKTGKLTTLSGNLSTSTGKLSTFTGKLSTFHEMVPFKIISSTVPFERHCVVLYLLQGLFIIPLHYYAFGFFFCGDDSSSCWTLSPIIIMMIWNLLSVYKR